MKTVLIFGGAGAPQQVFKDAAQAHGLECVFASTQSLRCEMTNEGIQWSLRDIDISNIDAILMRGIHFDSEHRNVVAQFQIVKEFCAYMVARGVKLYDEGFLEFDTLNKYEMTKHMVNAGLPTVPTRFIFSVREKKHLTYPCVVKPVVGSRGLGVQKLNSKADFRSWIRTSPYFPAMVQPWVPNSSDLRVVVIGGEVITTIRRARVAGDVNNLSQGGEGSEVQIDESLKQLAIRAAAAFKYNIAGIDLMQNEETGEWIVLEVNRSPGFTNTMKIASVNVIERIMGMIAQKLESR